MADKDKSRSHLERAYTLSSTEEARALYQDWALTYDEDLVAPLGYVGPVALADLVGRLATTRTRPVLDAGCGTGLVGRRLKELGFTSVDGLDYSSAMLAVARGHGLYRTLIEADLNTTLALEDGLYDMVVSCGTFTHGHVGAGALNELIRITAPDGHIYLSINEAIYESDGFADTLSGLQDRGLITVNGRERIPLLTEEGIYGTVPVICRTAKGFDSL
ncbi:class I SAM-dependent DNA methyltransferase [Coralliovum pocilloporae]|uniref:class I SAM-dependent DNA methyltransferase n=1 Tax=Coralliovum pocilloporae TaxID=3066369 RepID=UPI003306AF31